ncbi:UDP-N-acetylmuramate dehydrogenase [Streptomyces sp. NPDC005576]|uniref:UDP-N-acetylmuramate dehydrogenase n=1 Tax=Streptomyces sp. NPDC005576 TaxID=3364726 RepID=UPI0036A0BD01
MGELLADHTTLRLGGPADRFLTHLDPSAWTDLVHTLQEDETPPFVLGGGSNTLVADTGYRGTILRMATRGVIARPLGDDVVEVVAHAGEPLASLVAFSIAEGLSGIEYLGGIPGTTGAAPVQNTGAYGQQMSDTVARITAYDWHRGHTIEIGLESCGFGYRTSIFKTKPGQWTILAVTLRLRRSESAAPVTYTHLAAALDVIPGARPPLAEAAWAVISDRTQRGLVLPMSGPDIRQAGSVFLNPQVDRAQAAAIRAAGGSLHHEPCGVSRASAGWLLEQVGHLPASRIGPGIYCSATRALTLTARQQATASAFADAVRTLASDVHRMFDIRLRSEPVHLGQGGTSPLLV